MLTRFVFMLALAPTLAFADKNFEVGTGATYDCGDDPVVNIMIGKGTYTFTGACKQVNLNGGNITLTVDDVEELNVNGASNTVKAGELGALHRCDATR